MRPLLLRGLLAAAIPGGLLTGLLLGERTDAREKAKGGEAEKVDVDKLNKKIDNFTLIGPAGKVVALHGLKDKKAVVVVFLSFECPVSTSYSPVLAKLHQEYAPKGIAFLGINSSEDSSAAEIAKQAAEYKLPFPVLKDDRLKAADHLKARVVPEAFVLDHNFVLRYRGRIDNAYAARLKRNKQTTSHDLKKALDELLAGKAIGTPATRAVGCFIPRGEAVKATTNATYHRDVLPILQQNCQQCHRPGEVGPFALMTYKQAFNWASDIKDYTHDRRMPPWKPREGVPFHNERKLSKAQIDTLAAWVDGGAPEGDAKEAPPAKKFTEGWQLGKPDLVLEVPEEFTIGPSGKDVFRCFVLPTGLKEDKFVTAVEVRPGNKRVVHHSLNFFDLSGGARKKEKQERDRVKKAEEQDRGPGYSASMGIGFVPEPGKFGGVGGWAPGQRARHLPEGYGYPLPKGSDFVLQLHYHRNGRVEKDKTRIGLYFAKGAGVKPFKSMVIPGRFLVIPAGKERFRVKGTIEALEECELHSVMPHMHMLGKEIKVTMTPPGGQAKTLIDIKDWDYNWQETYFLKERLKVQVGTKFGVEAIFDNSASNPNNPFSPPQWVRFGEQTDNEMCFVFLGATNNARPGRIRVKFEGGTRRPPRPQPENERPGQGKPGAPGAAPVLPKPHKPTAYEVPYRLTIPKHILVRAKINGKGPYNFILDTGAPLLHIAVPVAKKAGLKADAKKWATIERFEIEGGVVVTNVKAHVETPFQLEGMNGLGLAGVEVHGMIGHSVLAKYRMTIDFTRDKMKWVPLDYQPQPLVGLGGKGGGQGGLEAIGGMMKVLGALMGKKAEPIVLLRGFLGATLADGEEYPVVKSVLASGPAGAAGVRVGDKISRVAGRGVYNTADVGRAIAREARPGQTFKLTVIRGAETKEINVKLGEGL